MLLNGRWQITGRGEDGAPIRLDGIVPGCIHTDLQAAGMIGDFYAGTHAQDVQWIEERDFIYSRQFTVDDLRPDAELIFHGLDTYAAVELNGVLLGETDDMFIPHRFAVDGILRAGDNLLRVTLRSPVAAVAGLPARPGAFTTERLYTRRIQCTYGWDWVHRFVTVGIFRDVELKFHRPNEIDNLYITTEHIGPYAAQLRIRLALRGATAGAAIRLTLAGPDGSTVWEKCRTVLQDELEEWVDLPNAALWYPTGCGAQPLYTLTVDTPSEKYTQRFGIRQITVLQLPDAPGSDAEQLCRTLQADPILGKWDDNDRFSCFWVLVNGVRVFCKGANWVPCEPFPSAETPQKIRRLIGLAAAGGVNTLRVWGGGLFEQDAFYDACDEAGLLVLQDFLMACGEYPEEDDRFIAALRNEAETAALRLRNHPCLAWWNGDNENATGGNENICDYPGYRSAACGIGPVLARLDPARRFLPSSPFGGRPFAGSTVGTTHNTWFLGDVLPHILQSDMTDFRPFFSRFLSRFNAEQCCFGMPFVSTLRRFLTEEEIFGTDTAVSEFHTRTNPGLPETLYHYAETLARKLFGAFADGADRIRKLQLLQCEWVRISMELQRRHKGFTGGMLYWMYNDCWPAAAGWSLIDYYARPKPAYYAFARAVSPVIVSLEENGGTVKAVLVNDLRRPVSGSGVLSACNVADGSEAVLARFSFTAAADSAETVCTLPPAVWQSSVGKDTVLLCDTVTDGGSDRAWLIPVRYADLDICWGDVTVTARDAESITITAGRCQPMVLLDLPYRTDANAFFLKAGESRTVRLLQPLE